MIGKNDGGKIKGTGVVRVCLWVPKGLLGFLGDLLKVTGSEMTVTEVLEKELSMCPDAILSELPDNWFNPQRIRKKYNLPEPEDC
ncbi:MAG: hypothetical protein WCC94_03135 [Candidatus Bathyarchaeia archaeon]